MLDKTLTIANRIMWILLGLTGVTWFIIASISLIVYGVHNA
jgi:hypothetical protein